nr:RNA-directed DNA polymerase, eukaryota [Tanacetum cinerariifolium]
MYLHIHDFQEILMNLHDMLYLSYPCFTCSAVFVITYNPGSSGLRRFFRYAMFIYSFYVCYVLSLYPFTERYAQPYFFSCLIRQRGVTIMVSEPGFKTVSSKDLTYEDWMVNTRTDADLSAAVQNALQTLLLQIRAEIREEFPTSSGPSDAAPVDAENWISHMEKIFDVIGCEDAFKTRLTVYKFESNALAWWKAYKQAKGGDALYALELNKNIDVASKMTYGNLGYSFRREPRVGVKHARFVSMLEKVEGIMVADTRDRWVWSLEGSGEFFVASVRRLIDDNMFPEVASKTRWIKVIHVKVNVHAWKVMLDCLSTRMNISRRGMEIESILCPMCGEVVESSRHIFFICRITREIVRKITRWWDVSYSDLSSYEEWLDWLLNLRLSVKHKHFFEGVWYGLWWHIWWFHNKCGFDSQIPLKAAIFDDIVSWSFYWCRYRCKGSFS